MAPPPDDHDCGWKKYAEAQAAELALMKEKLEALERRVLGKKSERLKSSKLPPPLPPKTIQMAPHGSAKTTPQDRDDSDPRAEGRLHLPRVRGDRIASRRQG